MIVSNIQFKVFIAFIFFITFIFSLYLSPFHIYGDQEHYNEAYYAVRSESFTDAWLKYTSIIYTGEPIHFSIIWFFSSLGLDKNLVMSFSNSLLAILYSKYLFDKKFSILLIALILISNYYLLTMFFTLERTKFAFIFFLLGLIYRNRFFYLVSVFTHSLMLFPLISYIVCKLFNFNNLVNSRHMKRISSKSTKLGILGLLFLGIFLYYFLGDHLVSKFNSYAFINFEIYQILIIFLFSLKTALNRNEVFVFFTIIIISIIILGGDRLNMVGYFAFLHFGDLRKLLFKQLILLLVCFYFIKSLIYVNMIITIGG